MTRPAALLLAMISLAAAPIAAEELKCPKIPPLADELVKDLSSCESLLEFSPDLRAQKIVASNLAKCRAAVCSALHSAVFEKKALVLQGAFDGRGPVDGKKKDLLALKKDYASLYPKMSEEPKSWTRDYYAKTVGWYMAACDAQGKPEKEPFVERNGPAWVRSLECRFGPLNEYSEGLDKDLKEHIASYASERRAALK